MFSAALWPGGFSSEANMVDDNKRTEPVKVWLTERELLDLSRLSAREDRKVGEMLRVIVRRAMYGILGAPDTEIHGAKSTD